MPNESYPDEPSVAPSTAPSADGGIAEAPRPLVRLGASSAYQFGAQVFALGINFVVSVLIARTLGPTGKGQLSVLQQVPGILAVLLSAGVGYSNLYFVGTRKHSPGMALGNSLAIASLAGIIGAPIVWLMTVGPLAIVPDLPSQGAAIAALILPVTLAASFIISIANGLGLLKKSSLANMLATAATLILIGVTFALDRLTVTAVLGISVVSGLTSLIFVVTAMRPHLERISLRLSAFRESARYSLKSYAGSLAGYINYRSDILMLGYMQGAKAVGIYSIAVTFAELMWYIPNALSTSLLAKSMAISASDGAAVTSRTARITSMLMVGSSVLAALLIAPIIRVFYGSVFLPAVIPFIVLIPGVWCMGIAKILSGYLAGHGKIFPGISAASAALNVALNLILIPPMGAAGAALASTVSYVALGACMGVAHKRHTGTPLRSLVIPTTDDVRALATAIVGYWRGLHR